MTPPSDLVECSNCDGLFTASSSDEVFYHATCRCRQEVVGSRWSVVSGETAQAADN